MARLTRPLPQRFCPQSSFGQILSGFSVIDWNFSNCWSHLEQTYSYVGIAGLNKYAANLRSRFGDETVNPAAWGHAAYIVVGRVPCLRRRTKWRDRQA